MELENRPITVFGQVEMNQEDFHTIPTEVLREGVEVFGTEDEFKNWYNTPNRTFNFTKPCDLTIEKVLEELARIKNGIV